jgi:hypothetical protein
LAVRPRVHRVLLSLGTAIVEGAGFLGLYQVEGRIGHKLERLQIEVGMRNARSAVRSGAAPEREARHVGDLELLGARPTPAARDRATRQSH